jgi:hypothetical protein
MDLLTKEDHIKVLRLAISPSWFLLTSLLVFNFVSVVADVDSFSYQSKTDVRKIDSGVEIRSGFNDIPEATEPSAPEEFEWWEKLRKAGNDLQKKSDKKSKAKFLLLLSEGQQKGYRIPLKDRPPQIIVFGKLTHSSVFQKGKITGTVIVSVEFRADGTVGDVKMTKELALGIDENFIRAIRQSVFLPAIKNGAFVTEWRTAGAAFSGRRN